MNDKQLRDVFKGGCESVPVEERSGREMIELAGLRALAHRAWREGHNAGIWNARPVEGWRDMTNPYNKEETK